MAKIDDVAALAGVSNVFSKKRPISQEVSARVLAAAKQLNYVPNHVARSLALKKTMIVGLNMPLSGTSGLTGFDRGIVDGVALEGAGIGCCSIRCPTTTTRPVTRAIRWTASSWSIRRRARVHRERRGYGPRRERRAAGASRAERRRAGRCVDRGVMQRRYARARDDAAADDSGAVAEPTRRGSGRAAAREAAAARPDATHDSGGKARRPGVLQAVVVHVRRRL